MYVWNCDALLLELTRQQMLVPRRGRDRDRNKDRQTDRDKGVWMFVCVWRGENEREWEREREREREHANERICWCERVCVLVCKNDYQEPRLHYQRQTHKSAFRYQHLNLFQATSGTGQEPTSQCTTWSVAASCFQLSCFVSTNLYNDAKYTGVQNRRAPSRTVWLL